MKLIADEMQIAAGFVPVNMATATNEGDWISLRNYRHVAILVFKAAGASGEPPTITTQQAKDTGGGDAKDLNFTTIHVKNGADLGAIGQFTKVTAVASNDYALAAGNTQALVLIEFNAEDLDADNGFDCIRATIADVGDTSQIGCMLYLLSSPRYTPPPSAIAESPVNS